MAQRYTSGIDIRIPGYVKVLMKSLAEAGYESFVVGGCVRDTVMGRDPGDWDVCTSALVADMLRVFSGYRTIDVGTKHGTVVVVSEGNNVEITTYRLDGSYADHRHPDSVAFTDDVTLDLARRDFTVNAMAYNDIRGLVDPFGGCGDIRARLIRAVGDPEQRFNEDALRIMRALRFSAALDFEIEDDTDRAANALAAYLDDISRERVHTELTKLLRGVGAVRVLRSHPGIVRRVIPETGALMGFDQHNRHHIYDVWEHTLRVIDGVPRDDDILRLAALFHDIGKPSCFTMGDDGAGHFPDHAAAGAEMTDGILTRLRFDKQTTTQVTELILYHDNFLSGKEPNARKMLAKLGEKQLRRLITLQKADVSAHSPETAAAQLPALDAAQGCVDQLIRGGACLHTADLAVNGDDVMSALKIAPSRRVGEILGLLLREVTDGRLDNDRASLLKYLDNLE